MPKKNLGRVTEAGKALAPGGSGKKQTVGYRTPANATEGGVVQVVNGSTGKVERMNAGSRSKGAGVKMNNLGKKA